MLTCIAGMQSPFTIDAREIKTPPVGMGEHGQSTHERARDARQRRHEGKRATGSWPGPDSRSPHPIRFTWRCPHDRSCARHGLACLVERARPPPYESMISLTTPSCRLQANHLLECLALEQALPCLPNVPSLAISDLFPSSALAHLRGG